jgi:hypothetical protein
VRSQVLRVHVHLVHVLLSLRAAALVDGVDGRTRRTGHLMCTPLLALIANSSCWASPRLSHPCCRSSQTSFLVSSPRLASSSSSGVVIAVVIRVVIASMSSAPTLFWLLFLGLGLRRLVRREDDPLP